MKKVVCFLFVFLLAASLASAIICKTKVPSKEAVLKLKNPDLVITSIKVDTSKADDSQQIKIIYVITNKGKSTAPASITSLSISTKDKKQNGKTIRHQVPILRPQQSYEARINYPLVDRGDYNLKVSADYNNKLTESDELNNNNTMSFSVGFKLFR